MKNTFTTTGKLRIGDPCYGREDPGLVAIIDVKPGTYVASVHVVDFGELGKRITQLRVVHSAHVSTDLRSESILVVGVDSGQMSISDYSAFPVDEDPEKHRDEFYRDAFYDQLCAITLGSEGWGGFPGGVVSRSGFGDGAYHACALLDGGVTVGAFVQFIQPEEF